MKKNEITPFVRQCITLWFAGNTDQKFTVSQICRELKEKHSILLEIDLCKAVSNELIRLESLGIMTSRKGAPEDVEHGTGRPPRVYRLTYCTQSLFIIQGFNRGL